MPWFRHNISSSKNKQLQEISNPWMVMNAKFWITCAILSYEALVSSWSYYLLAHMRVLNSINYKYLYFSSLVPISRSNQLLSIKRASQDSSFDETSQDLDTLSHLSNSWIIIINKSIQQNLATLFPHRSLAFCQN